MRNLPDDLWTKVMEMGVESCGFGHRDLCSLSLSCRRFLRLSSEPSLWTCLLFRDFPSSSSQPIASAKSLYRTKFERDKARKLTAWRLDVLNVESQIAVCSKNVGHFRDLLFKEHCRLKSAAAEHLHLEQLRRASVALNVWQPEVVRSSQRKMVAQCSVPIESRVSTVEMEIELCKQHISTYTISYEGNKRRLFELKEKLASVKYHPVHSVSLDNSFSNLINKKRRLKQCTE